MTKKTYLLIASLLLALMGGCVSALPKSSQNSCSSQFEIFDMIRNKNYDGLEGSLRACQENYEKDVNAEIALYSAYEAFNSSYPSLEPALNDWVNKYPSSYVARLARGNYLMHKGQRARGTKWASDTTEQQFQAMNETFEFAAKDLNDAIRLFPKCLVAYCGLININGASSTSDSMRRIMEAGLGLLPDSLMIRQRYLHYLQPKWGGTESDLNEIMLKIEGASKKYEKLRILRGYRDIISAEELVDQKNYDKALTYFLKALEHGDFFYYYERLGIVYHVLQKYDLSIAACSKAIQIGPLGIYTIHTRSHSLIQVGSLTEALKDMNLGLSLFPDDTYLRGLRDYCNNIASGTYELTVNFMTKNLNMQNLASIAVLPIDAAVPWLQDKKPMRDIIGKRNSEKMEQILRQIGLTCIEQTRLQSVQKELGFSGTELSDHEGSSIGKQVNARAVVITTFNAVFQSMPIRTYHVTIKTRAVSTETSVILWQFSLQGIVKEERGQGDYRYVLDNMETQLYKLLHQKLSLSFEQGLTI